MYEKVLKDSAASTKAWVSRRGNSAAMADANKKQLAGLQAWDKRKASGAAAMADANKKQLAGLQAWDKRKASSAAMADANKKQLAGLQAWDKRKAAKTDTAHMGSIAAAMGVV